MLAGPEIRKPEIGFGCGSRTWVWFCVQRQCLKTLLRSHQSPDRPRGLWRNSAPFTHRASKSSYPFAMACSSIPLQRDMRPLQAMGGGGKPTHFTHGASEISYPFNGTLKHPIRKGYNQGLYSLVGGGGWICPLLPSCGTCGAIIFIPQFPVGWGRRSVAALILCRVGIRLPRSSQVIMCCGALALPWFLSWPAESGFSLIVCQLSLPDSWLMGINPGTLRLLNECMFTFTCK